MNYETVYSDRHTVSLCVRDGRLIVRAPYGTPRERVESIIAKHRRWVEKHISKSRRIIEAESRFSDADIAGLRECAKTVLKDKTDYFSKIMGLKYGRITITSAKTRFGSCSSKGNICYSYRLMLYPDEAIDYVVVHELAHLVEMNHSKKFYAIVERYIPDYKERIKMLRS